jgi:hypothetical protein
MSTLWQTTVYFPLQEHVSLEQIATMLDKLAEADLLLPPEPEFQPTWFSWNSLEQRKIRSLDEALQLTEQFRGGQIGLFSHDTMTYVYLIATPCGITPYETSADYQYGSIGLRLDYAYLHSEPHDLIRRRYIQLFRWSNIIAQAFDAIYGWGDIEQYVSSGPNDTVPAAALRQWQIPRFSWWNYFSEAYIKQVGENRLFSAGNWITTYDNNALIIILRPPEEEQVALNKSDLDQIFGRRTVI